MRPIALVYGVACSSVPAARVASLHVVAQLAPSPLRLPLSTAILNTYHRAELGSEGRARSLVHGPLEEKQVAGEAALKTLNLASGVSPAASRHHL